MSEAMDIANYIVDYSLSKGYSINNLKLQKLLYYANAKYLVENDYALFDENIEKWKLGPVVPQVYHEFKKYGANEISKPEETVEIVTADNSKGWKYILKEFDKDNILENVRIFLNSLVDKLEKFGPFELVEMTHREPMWNDYEREINAGTMHLTYSNDEIIQYFKENRFIWDEDNEQ